MGGLPGGSFVRECACMKGEGHAGMCCDSRVVMGWMEAGWRMRCNAWKVGMQRADLEYYAPGCGALVCYSTSTPGGFRILGVLGFKVLGILGFLVLGF